MGASHPAATGAAVVPARDGGALVLGPSPGLQTVTALWIPATSRSPNLVNSVRKPVSVPYPASASTTPSGMPRSRARRICASAISGLVRNGTSAGIPAFSRRRHICRKAPFLRAGAGFGVHETILHQIVCL